jgi:hypothetical protein
MEPLKIFTVCLTDRRKFKAYAVYDGENLVITHVSTISGGALLSSWKKGLSAEIEEKRSKGFVVVVEELGDAFSTDVSRYNLDEADDDGRSNFYTALDWYFHLEDTNCLTVATEARQYEIRSGGEGTRIEKKQDDKGRTAYNIDWKWLHGGHRAILLCVVACQFEPLSGRYLEAMWPQEDISLTQHPYDRWQQLLDERAAGANAEIAMQQLGRA